MRARLLRRPSSDDPSAWRVLVALPVGGFAIGLGEFVLVGLLPNVASTEGVTIPTAGHLISAYAIGVVVGSPVLAIAAARVPQRTSLAVLMSLFAIGNGLSALAPNYRLLLLARFVSGLPHGAFFGLGAVVGGDVLGEAKRAKAIAWMFSGLTAAIVVGVPATTFIGQHLGWRSVFGIVAFSGAMAAWLAYRTIPQKVTAVRPSHVRVEFKTFRDRQVLLLLATAMTGCGGLFATLSYITPMMTKLAGYGASDISWILVIFGVGLSIGNALGAWMGDRWLIGTVICGFIAEAVIATVFIFTVHDHIAAVVTMLGLAIASIVVIPALQSRIILKAREAPNLASSAIQAAFNIGNALGAWLGGVVIALGLGYGAPNAVAAGLAIVGLAIAIYSHRLEASTRVAYEAETGGPTVTGPPGLHDPSIGDAS